MRTLLLTVSLAVLLLNLSQNLSQNNVTIPQYTASTQSATIHVTATVTDPQGNFVRDLKASDFVLEEDGKARPFLFTANIDTPVTIGILLDDSLSMQLNNRWEAAVNLCRVIIRMMKPDDEFMLMKFAGGMSHVQGLTTDRSKIESFLREMGPAESGTDVIGSVEKALDEVKKGHNRGRGLILVSDAEDNSGGDIHSMSDWMNTRELPVFTVAVRPPLGEITAGFGGGFGRGGFGTGTMNVGSLIEALSLAEPRRRLVLETSSMRKVDTPGRIAQFVYDMDADLRGQYKFGILSIHEGPSWERIVRIRVPSMPNVKIHSRWQVIQPEPQQSSQK